MGLGWLRLDVVLSGLWKLPELLLAEGAQFDPEPILDELGICDCQSVLGWKTSMRPAGRRIA
jgi:hypothetical protein